jgi:hypothetical protein
MFEFLTQVLFLNLQNVKDKPRVNSIKIFLCHSMWMDQTKPECLYPTSYGSIILFMTGFNSLFLGDLHFKNKF